MGIKDLELKRSDILWVVGVMCMGAVSLLGGLVFVYGPLWPVGRLHLLRANNQSLAADGIDNPEAQRMFSLVALACLITLPIDLWMSAHLDLRWYVVAAFAALLYSYLTYIVFEFSLWRTLGWAGSWLATILFAATLAGKSEEDSDDCPTPDPAPHSSKTTVGNFVGVLFIAGLALAIVWTAVSEILCAMFNFCM